MEPEGECNMCSHCTERFEARVRADEIRQERARNALVLEHSLKLHAEQIRQEEREVCAKFADEDVTRDRPAAALDAWQQGYSKGRQDAAAAIRARGGGKPERIPGATEVEPGVYVANESLSLWPKMKP